MIITILKKIGIFLFILFLLLQLSFILIFFAPKSYFSHFPFFQAYVQYFSELFSGQLHLDLVNNSHTFIHYIKEELPDTIELCIFALFISFVAGVSLGVIAGLQTQSWLNKIIHAIGLVIASCPLIWIAVLIIDSASDYSYLLPDEGADLERIPSITYFPFIDILLAPNIQTAHELFKELRYMFLPAAILSIYPTFITVMLVSQRIAHIARQNYITTIMIREQSQWKILFQNMLPNVLPAIMPKFAYNLTLILFYAMLIEIIFDRPGLGSWAMTAYQQKNITALSVIMILCGLIICTLNLLIDLVTIVIRPLRNKELYHE